MRNGVWRKQILQVTQREGLRKDVCLRFAYICLLCPCILFCFTKVGAAEAWCVLCQMFFHVCVYVTHVFYSCPLFQCWKVLHRQTWFLLFCLHSSSQVLKCIIFMVKARKIFCCMYIPQYHEWLPFPSPGRLRKNSIHRPCSYRQLQKSISGISYQRTSPKCLHGMPRCLYHSQPQEQRPD